MQACACDSLYRTITKFSFLLFYNHFIICPMLLMHWADKILMLCENIAKSFRGATFLTHTVDGVPKYPKVGHAFDLSGQSSHEISTL